jgi:hypothetical protein
MTPGTVEAWNTTTAAAEYWTRPETTPEEWTGTVDEASWAAAVALQSPTPATLSSPSPIERSTLQNYAHLWTALGPETSDSETDYSTTEDEDFTKNIPLLPLPTIELPAMNIEDLSIQDSTPPAPTNTRVETPVAFARR